MEKPVPQSSFMFLVACNEAFGYTHEQALDSSFVLLLAMLREHGFRINERNKILYPDEEDTPSDFAEWMEVVDFDTGQKKKIRKTNSI